MITIMGATGNTGSKIARALLGDGQAVRAIGRNRENLASLETAGAEIRVGDSRDVDFLTEAFRGADAAYTLLPTDQRAADYPGMQRREGEAIASAVRASGARHVVALSCVGTDAPDGTGVILGLRQQERRLSLLEDVNVLFLRPVSFFENFYGQLEGIFHQGAVVDSVEADVAIPMVATRDIADAAARALIARDWHGVAVRELLGPRDLSYREATRIIGERIGIPDLPYVQLPYHEMAAVLAQVGLSESFASRYVEMTRAFNEGIVQPLHGRTAANTTPTTFESFADELAAAYRAMVESAAA